MGASRIAKRTTITVIITILQIKALISVKTTTVTGLEGHEFDIRCEYPDGCQNNAKYFKQVDDNESCLISTNEHNQWIKKGRFSLYDNTTAAFFIVKVDKLVQVDSGTYCCGVVVNDSPDRISFIQLNVSQAANPPKNVVHCITETPILRGTIKVDKYNLPLFLTAVMCVTAMLFVCLFTLCLLLTVKRRRSGPRQNREISSDYETMVPGVGTEPGLHCSCSAPNYPDFSASSLPPPDLCSHFTTKHRESTVTLGLGEYFDVDAPGNICQYQHLDLSQLEEHVYHSLHGNKDGPLAVKEQINC